jgi:hypothetical protein
MAKRAGASCCACEWTSGLAVGRPVKQIVDRAPPRPYDPALYTVRRQDLVPLHYVRYCTRGMVTFLAPAADVAGFLPPSQSTLWQPHEQLEASGNLTSAVGLTFHQSSERLLP